MLLKEYKTYFITKLEPLYDVLEAESFFYIVLESYHKLKRIDVALQPNLEITLEQKSYWDKVLQQLQNYKPIQYILGKTEFFGLPFYVNENTLIPRPETEELVDWILQSLPKAQSVLDIGTGSGCIAISLKKNMPQVKVYALDVSEQALKIAEQNAQVNNVDIQFIQQNILVLQDIPLSFDCIVSNPPYVRELEKAAMKPNVLNFEPHLALFVEDTDALLFYRKIAHFALKHLKPNGKLFFEINQYLAQETIAMLAALNFKNIQLKKDIYNNDRMIQCSL